MIDSKSGQLVLGRYRVVRRLTQGGMGVVYLGRVEGDAGFAKAVVIKRILQDIADVEEHTAQFIREAQILSHLQHPGIVGVLDFGRSGDGYSMVLEYVHGYDLGRWLKYLQNCQQRMHFGMTNFCSPSRFLKALPAEVRSSRDEWQTQAQRLALAPPIVTPPPAKDRAV